MSEATQNLAQGFRDDARPQHSLQRCGPSQTADTFQTAGAVPLEAEGPLPTAALAAAQLPSPWSSVESRKRKRSQSSHLSPKPPNPSYHIYDKATERIAYWAENLDWNTDLFTNQAMAEPPKRSRSRSSSNVTSSTPRHEYIASLGQFFVFMNDTRPDVEKDSRNQCQQLLGGTRINHCYLPLLSPIFPALLDILSSRGEERIRRDVSEWIAPSPEKLNLLEEADLKHLREEVGLPWTRCESMGGTFPKPDLTVGLTMEAFSSEERVKLQNWATSRKPFQVMSGLCFPFFTCELKSGEQGLNKAQRQNVHAGAIAVRAIVDLYKDAFGAASDALKDIYGKVLCFSISHDWDQVIIHGHYVIFDAETQCEHYYRHYIQSYHLRREDDRLRPYNFTRDLYEKFSIEHLGRIQKAAAQLSMMPPPAVSIDRQDSGPVTESASVLLAHEVTELRSQLQTEVAKLSEVAAKHNEEVARRNEEVARRNEEAAKHSKEREALTAQIQKLSDEIKEQREANTQLINKLIDRLPKEAPA